MATTTADHHAHDDHHDDEHDEDYLVHAHISSVQTYLAVFGGLLLCTGATVAAYNVRLGDWNLIVAVLIATMKATLVCTWFMHLKYEQRFNTLFFVGSLLFASVFLGYTLNDTDHRAETTIQGARRDPGTGNYAYGTAVVISENGEFEPMPEGALGDHDDHEPGAAEPDGAHDAPVIPEDGDEPIDIREPTEPEEEREPTGVEPADGDNLGADEITPDVDEDVAPVDPIPTPTRMIGAITPMAPAMVATPMAPAPMVATPMAPSPMITPMTAAMAPTPNPAPTPPTPPTPATMAE